MSPMGQLHLPRGLHVSRVKTRSIPLPLFTMWTHCLLDFWLLLQALSYCSSILKNCVVLMSVGFITWVEKLNETCYTILNSESMWRARQGEHEVNVVSEWAPTWVVFWINRWWHNWKKTEDFTTPFLTVSHWLDDTCYIMSHSLLKPSINTRS